MTMQLTLSDFYVRLFEKGSLVGTASEKFTVIPDPSPSGACVEPEHRVHRAPSDKRRFQKPIQVEHVIFEVYVDLSECAFKQSLRLEDCEFLYGLGLADTHIQGLCSLKGSIFKAPQKGWLNFNRLCIDGLFDCTLIESDACIDLTNLQAGDDVWFDGASIKSAILDKAAIKACEHHWESDVDKVLCDFHMGTALCLDGAKIRCNLYFQILSGHRFQAFGKLDLRADIGGQVSFVNAKISAIAKKGKAIYMNNADVKASIYFKDNTEIRGTVDLRAKVGGQITFDESVVTVRREDMAIDLEFAEVKDAIFVRKSKVNGRIDLRARISGLIKFENTSVVALSELPTVNFDSAEVGGTITFNETRVVGRIDLRARVGGSVIFENQSVVLRTKKNLSGQKLSAKPRKAIEKLPAKPKKAIDMTAAEVGGSVIFGSDLKVRGGIDLSAKVSGDISFERSIVDTRTSEAAVDMEALNVGKAVFFASTVLKSDVIMIGATVNRGIFINNRAGVYNIFLLYGKLDLSYAKVTGPVDIYHARFTSPILAKHLTVDGDFNLNGCECHSEVTFEDAMIEGDVNLEKSTLESDLILRSARVGGRLFGDPESGVERYPQVIGEIDLRYAELKHVSMRFEKGHKFFPKSVLLDGAKAEQLELLGKLPARDSAGTPGFKISVEGLKFESLALENPKHKSQSLEIDEGEDREFRDQAVRLASYFSALLLLLGWLTTSLVWYQAAVSTTLLRSLLFLLIAASAWGCSLATVELIYRRIADEISPYGWSPRDMIRIGFWLIMASLIVTLFAAPGSRVWLLITFFYIGHTLIGTMRQPHWMKLISFRDAGTYLVLDKKAVRRKRVEAKRDSRLLCFLKRIEFSRGFFSDVEQNYRSRGYQEAADEVFITRRKQEVQLAGGVVQALGNPKKWTWFQRLLAFVGNFHPWRNFVDLIVGYGIRYRRPIHIFLLLWLINTAIFTDHSSIERPLTFVQLRSDLRVENERIQSLALDDASITPWDDRSGKPQSTEWSTSDGFFMATRIQFPFVNLIAENDWEASSEPMPLLPIDLKYENYASLCMLANLILLPTIIAGMTGYLKKNN